jgi:hypothetical protein
MMAKKTTRTNVTGNYSTEINGYNMVYVSSNQPSWNGTRNYINYSDTKK